MEALRKLGLFFTLALAWPAPPATAQTARPAPPALTWKPIENCVLRVDDRPAKLWEVYLVPKKKNLVLVQLGSRFLQLDTEAREIYEIAPEALERKGRDLIEKPDSGPPADSGNRAAARDASKGPAQGGQRQRGRREPLPSAEWTERDAGRARIIRLRLTAEGRRLEVQLPIDPDLRKFY